MSNDNTPIEIKVPVLPESVSDAVVISWYKHPGETVKRDEPLVDIETDKVVLEVPSPVDGVLETIVEDDGATVTEQQILGTIKAQDISHAEIPEKPQDKAEQSSGTDKPVTDKQASAAESEETLLTPSARKLIIEHKLDQSQIKASGKGGRILKEDVLNVINQKQTTAGEQTAAQTKVQSATPTGQITSNYQSKAPKTDTQPDMDLSAREEQRVPMTRLRARIAQRLLEAQHNAAILTTFNEVNMKPVMDLRKQYKELFEKTHNIKLGFMSFFVKASVEALKQFPAVNASIDDNDIIYHNYFDIGIAVSSPRGLVVPVLRNAQNMSMAGIESTIKELAIKARDSKLSIDDLTGGTFSITNGGIFGSLLSTPILNPPQSAILGMHKIEDRPVVVNGEIVIRPVMYLALSYDHRIIDGREAVQFLVAIKNYLEDPARLLLEV